MANIITDDFIGGKTFEHLDHQPVTVYSKSELKREMDKRGLRHTDRHVPGDKHLTNWGRGIDAQTLENARILLTRGQKTKASDVTCETFKGELLDLPGSLVVDRK